ncbi:isochorismatase domain-containing protein 1 [Tachypleus tridentatus]|uniref:isochorismatase domain-containing protein 1 n=1 Tax=Tachypleus tridentatus TaxID=6853 RepID=UPI003FCF1BD5
MISAERVAFLLCDMQVKFRPAIKYFQEITEVSQKLVETSKILNIPLIVTEQYPEGLGSTIPELDVAHAVGIFPKTKFSMLIPEVENALANKCCSEEVEAVILFGIEAHVCIEQTALDLRAKNIQVHIVADATSSRSQEDRLLAFERLRQYGCFVSTSESVIFKLLKDKNHPDFNVIRPLIKNVSPQTGLSSRI